MKYRYFFWFAYKNLASRKLRTLITTMAITIGTSAIVFLVSLGFGFQDLVTKQVASMETMNNIKATSGNSKIIKIDDAKIEELKSFGNVDKIEPLITIPAKIKNNKSITDVVVYGASSEYLRMNEVSMLKGVRYTDEESDAILLNKTAAELLGITEKNFTEQKPKLSFTISKNLQTEEGAIDKVVEDVEFSKVKGIIDANSSAYVYIPQSKLFELGVGVFSEATIKMKDKTQIEPTRKAIENSGLKTQYIGDTVEQINQVFSTFQVILAVVGAIALVIAALGMLNTLTVTLLEKTREVGFMKALGVKNNDVFKLFLSESLLISFFGGIIGIFVGVGTGKLLNYIVNMYAVGSGNDPVQFFATPWWFIAVISVFSAFVGFLTGIFPARRAAKINPLDALRYE